MTKQISGSTRLAAVIGYPVRHSLSPAMHNAAFAANGLDWRFVALEVSEGRGADAVAAMRTLGISGMAVTMPHKEDVAQAVDEVDAASSLLGSVNTVVLRDDGSTFGASTDGAGFVSSLSAAGIAVVGLRAVVVGAGSAARSIIAALDAAGIADVSIVNRSASSADRAASISAKARVGCLADIELSHLVVNTTSVGMGTDQTPFDVGLLRSDLIVADIVYHPIDTALLRAARKVGARAVDGLGMLAHQAALQQALWTGVVVDPHSMRCAAEAELAERER